MRFAVAGIGISSGTDHICDGKFGHNLPMGLVGRCGDCGVECLSESCCKDEAFYESTVYRLLVDKSTPLTLIGGEAMLPQLALSPTL